MLTAWHSAPRRPKPKAWRCSGQGLNICSLYITPQLNLFSIVIQFNNYYFKYYNKAQNMKATININSSKPLVLIPLEDYEGMLETIDILSGNSNILNELKKEKKEFEKGNYIIYPGINNKKLRQKTSAKMKK